MGIINHSAITFDNGLEISDCYLSFTSGPVPFPLSPPPITISWVADENGTDGRFKTFRLSGMLFIHANYNAKIGGSRPIETRLIDLGADHVAVESGASVIDAVFQVLYTHLTALYPNSERY
jgi:hypothetical protein